MKAFIIVQPDKSIVVRVRLSDGGAVGDIVQTVKPG